MKIIYSLIIFLFTSCSSGKLLYDFEMRHPVKSKELYYENDTISISYTIKPKYIEFTILNKINDGIKISWDEVSLAVNGKSYRVVHKETGIYKMSEVQPPTTIAPKSTLRDAVIMTKNVVYTSNSKNGAILLNMFPDKYYNKKEKIKYLKLNGAKITIFLPYYIGGKYVSMYYDIYINNIKS